VVGQGRWQHPFHFHGNHARVLARDGNLMLSTVTPAAGAAPALAGPLLFTPPTVSGQTQDQIFTWTGKGLNWDVYGHSVPMGGVPGATPAGNALHDAMVCYPDASGYYTVNSTPAAPATAPNYGEWCADHNKAIPVTPPDPLIVANGLWYGGSPYLGLSSTHQNLGFNSTPLPPGFASQNTSAGYAYMWHSHNEREITTNNVFPGGMMMMLIIDPPSASIDETL
jgi:FtsP/CotA-like multicopper oxidase with cupredoxin domain